MNCDMLNLNILVVNHDLKYISINTDLTHSQCYLCAYNVLHVPYMHFTGKITQLKNKSLAEKKIETLSL